MTSNFKELVISCVLNADSGRYTDASISYSVTDTPVAQINGMNTLLKKYVCFNMTYMTTVKHARSSLITGHEKITTETRQS